MSDQWEITSPEYVPDTPVPPWPLTPGQEAALLDATAASINAGPPQPAEED